MLEKTVLPNGLRVLSSHMPYTRAVTVTLLTGAGARFETPQEAGISHYLEHMFFKGTPRRPQAQDISGAIEGVGGIMNGSTDQEDMILWTKVGRPHFTLAVDVIADMLRNSKIEQEEIEKERQVILEEINMVYDTPGQMVFLLMDELMFPDHPLGRDVAGSHETVRGIDQAMLNRYLREQYSPTNTVISIAGDVDHSEVTALIAESLGDWQPTNPRPLTPLNGNKPESPIRVEYKKTEQAHICIGAPGISALDPDRFALDTLISILGEGMSSRLFVELRERQGLVYEVSASANHFQDTGSVIFYAATEPRRAVPTLKALLHELARIPNDLTEADLTRTRELIRGRMLLRMEDSRSVAGWYGGQELLRREVLTPDDVAARYDAVTLDDVRRIARQTLEPEGLRLAVFGPFRKEERFRKVLLG